jgi:hypothetical protein
VHIVQIIFGERAIEQGFQRGVGFTQIGERAGNRLRLLAFVMGNPVRRHFIGTCRHRRPAKHCTTHQGQTHLFHHEPYL